MKHQHFDVETAGFYGAYWACTGGADCAKQDQTVQ